MPSLIPVVICDIDSTLSDDAARYSAHKHDGSPFTPDELLAYDLASGDDPPIPYMIDTIRALSLSYDIFLVTGRTEQAAEVTAEWLDRYSVPWEELLMRSQGDTRPNDQVKMSMYEAITQELARTVELVIDDNPLAIARFNELGVNTLQVNRPTSPPRGA